MAARSRRIASPTAFACALLLLGCSGPAPTSGPAGTLAAVADGCVDLGAEIWSLAWSPGGEYLAVATWDGEGHPRAWVLTPDGRLAGETLTIPSLVLDALAVAPDGRRAWLVSELATPRHTLVEERPLGLRETRLPPALDKLRWTTRGYAMVERREVGDRIVLVDPEDPGTLVELHGGDSSVRHIWISADGRVLLLSAGASDGGTMFRVIDPVGEHVLQPAAADASGASLVDASVVYHALSGEMVVVPVIDPESPAQLSERRGRLGAASDRGMLALATFDGPGVVCFEDVRARLE